jgi:hypothetical protein
MSFSEKYLENFTPADQQSIMCDMVSKIGDTVEQEVHTEMQKLVADNVDFSAMSSDGCRKFLSYVQKSAPNFLAANGQVFINVISASTLFTIPAGSVLISSGGEQYFNVSALNLQQGQQLVFNVMQGFTKTVTGTYDTYISVTDANIDLSTVSLTINGTPINPVLTPLDGYIAFYFGGTLYVKVFAGPNVPAVAGQSFVLSYVVCDGSLGNINANELSQFQSPIFDNNNNLVVYSLSHDGFSNGFDAPTQAELQALVKYWFYTKDTIVRISDYTAWFLAQESVGDCYCYGDTEYYNLTGILNITGLVNVILVPSNGGYFFQSDYDAFNVAIAPYKDCAVLNYLTYESVYYYFAFQFTASKNNQDFENQISTSLQDYFNVQLERAAGRSLFGPFDLDLLYRDPNIQAYAPANLTIVPYYVDPTEWYVVTASPSTSVSVPTNVKVGYSYHKFTPKDGSEATITAVVSGGHVTNFIIVDGGSGYTEVPVIVLTPVSGGAGAEAVAVLTNGVITAINIISGGAGYSVAPTVTTVGPNGTALTIVQATAHSTRVGGGVDHVTMDLKGYGYNSLPVIQFTGGGGANAAAHAVIVNGVVDHIDMDSAGTGYTSAPTVTVVGGLAGAVGEGYVLPFTEVQTAVEGVFDIEDPLGTVVGSHNYTTNVITWSVTFAKGVLQTYSELLNRGYLVSKSFLCVRKLIGFEADVTSLTI